MLKFCNTTPRSGDGPSIGLPSTVTEPPLASSRPDDVKQGGLAAAARPDDADEFASTGFERNVAQRQEFAALSRAVALRHVRNDDVRRVGSLFHGFLRTLTGSGHRWDSTAIAAHRKESGRALAAAAWRE
jgi:hypothetical protein